MNKITQLFNIKYPIIQGGMIWNSGYKLASAVSNAGGLGLIGAGSMYPEVLREHIQKCKKATDKPFGVNVPMLYPNIEEIMQILKEEEVKMGGASLTDGTKVMWEGELAEGTIVLLEDGTAAPDGEHTFEDGTVISIEGGQVVAVAKPMTEQEMAIQKLTEMVTKLETENAELKSNFEKQISESVTKVEEKFSAQIKESNKLTEDVLELVKTLVAEPTQHTFNSQSKPKSYIDGLAAQLKYEQTKIK